MRRTSINLHSPLQSGFFSHIRTVGRIATRTPLPLLVFITIALLGLTVQAGPNSFNPFSSITGANSDTVNDPLTISTESESSVTSSQNNQTTNNSPGVEDQSQSANIQMHTSTEQSVTIPDSGGAESQPSITINGEEITLPDSGRMRTEQEFESDTMESETKIKLDIDGDTSNTSINIHSSSD